MPGLNSAVSIDAVKTAIDKVYYQEFEYPQLPGMAGASDPMVFKQDTANKSAVIVDQFQGTGYFETRAENQDAKQTSARIGNQQTYSVLNYSQDLTISKNFYDDEQFSVVANSVRDMARTARLTQDKNAMDLYNNAFTTVVTQDDVAAFSASHIAMNGDTVDNLISGALSETTLKTAFQRLAKMPNQAGVIGSYQPQVLLVPVELFPTAMEITKSTLRAGTGNNDLNYFSDIYPGLMIKQSAFLTSTTAWFVLSRQHSFTRWVRQGIETGLVDWRITLNRQYRYTCDYRETLGVISYEGAVGATGL